MAKPKKGVGLIVQKKKKRPPTIAVQESSSSMTTAAEMIPEVAYRYRGTPTCFYMRPKTVTPDKLRKRLMRRYQALGGREMYLLGELERLEDPVVVWRITRTRVDGKPYERKETCVLDGALPVRKLKNTPGYG